MSISGSRYKDVRLLYGEEGCSKYSKDGHLHMDREFGYDRRPPIDDDIDIGT